MSIHKHGKGNGKYLRRARKLLGARRVQYSRAPTGACHKHQHKAPGSMKGRS